MQSDNLNLIPLRSNYLVLTGEKRHCFSPMRKLQISHPHSNLPWLINFHMEDSSLFVIKSKFETFGLKSAYSVGLLDPSHILVRFNHEDDYHQIWLREQWTCKCIQYVSSSGHRISALTVSPLLLRCGQIYHNFRLIFFAQSSLFSIARVLKEPMRIDVATKMLTRPSVAQLCVEMDLLQKFSNRIWIGCGAGGFQQGQQKYPRVQVAAGPRSDVGGYGDN